MDFRNNGTLARLLIKAAGVNETRLGCEGVRQGGCGEWVL